MFDAAQTELLVIDFQEKLFAAMPEGHADGERDRAVTAVNNLLYLAGELWLPITVTEQYPRGIGPTIPALIMPPTAVCVEKLAFSAEREVGIHPRSRPEVLIVGMEAHICVALTAMDLLAKGNRVIIVADGCLSRHAVDRDRGLALCARSGAVIVSSETVLFGLIQRAGTPLFKEVSRRIK